MSQNAAAPAAPAVHTQKPKRYTTVASKLPMHLELQCCITKDVRVSGQYGSTTEVVSIKSGPVVTIRGIGYPAGNIPKNFPDRPQINDAGYSLTHGVDADFFDEWLRQNADTDIVRNGLIFAHHDVASLVSIGREKRLPWDSSKSVDSGLGPINPDGDVRSPKPLNSALTPIKRDDGGDRPAA